MKISAKLGVIALCFIMTACDKVNMEQVGNIGTELVAQSVQNECQQTLQNNEGNIGGLANVVLSEEQKQAVCTCVGGEIKNSLKPEELQKLFNNGSVNTDMVSTLVANTINTCVGELTPNNTQQ